MDFTDNDPVAPGTFFSSGKMSLFFLPVKRLKKNRLLKTQGVQNLFKNKLLQCHPGFLFNNPAKDHKTKITVDTLFTGRTDKGFLNHPGLQYFFPLLSREFSQFIKIGDVIRKT